MSISRTLGILRKLKYILPTNALFSIYNTLSLPQLQYGILAWGNSNLSNLNKLLVIQNKSLRVINHSNSRAHARPLFHKFNTLPIHELYKYHLGVIMFKYDRNLLPTSLSSLFTRNTDIHQYNTRNSRNLHFYRARTSKYLSTTKHQGPIFWNSLSPLPPLRSIGGFKKYLKKYLLSKNCN